MKYNRFGIAVIIQSVLLGIAGTATVYILMGDYLLITRASFLALWCAQILLLIRYVNKTNRELDSFLQSLKHLDKVQLTGSGKSFRRLNQTYNGIIDVIRSERVIREREFQYFRDTVEHINTGLITFRRDGKISTMNRAAKEILGCGRTEYIDQLAEVSSTLPETLRTLEPGRPQLLTLQIGGRITKISVNLALLRIRNEYISLVSLADIRGELEEGELEAWQKLIRILTHEIVNSVTPIHTLTATMLGQLDKDGLPDSDLNKRLSSGIRAIRTRNKGLLAFVENFRKINKVPRPDFRKIEVSELLDNLKVLIKDDLNYKELVINIKENFKFTADGDLIIQVLINLVKNAAEAGAHRIEIITGMDASGRPRIMVSDDGSGVPEENLDRIFIPFYSSREKGSGIGLSLSRQIMRLHRGEIYLERTGQQGTDFVLSF